MTSEIFSTIFYGQPLILIEGYFSEFDRDAFNGVVDPGTYVRMSTLVDGGVVLSRPRE